MIPVYQRNERDCFRSCVASILEIPYEESPDLPDDEWEEPLIEWANKRNLKIDYALSRDGVPPRAWCVMATSWNGLPGRDKNGHCVVFSKSYKGDIAHDPFPLKAESEPYGEPMYWIWFTEKS